jgi:sugar-specific transcriptional regulator TrmB
MGFVEHISTRPIRFRAAPIESVINTMLHHKSEELSKLQIETEKLLHDQVQNKKKDNLKADTPEIIHIPAQRPLLKRTKNELNSLENSLYTICSWKKGIGWISNHYDQFTNALNRNVKIRFIIEKSEESRFPRFVEKLQNNPLFKLRTIQVLPPTCLSLYDQKILLIDTSSKTGFVKSPAIWTNNPSIVGMAQIYFQTLWTDSLPAS